MSELDAKGWEALLAYHDGELRGLSRWRFERRVRRSPVLRRELEVLARVGGLVRESEVQGAGPDLWERIEQRLPALDARRAEAEQRAGRLAPGSWLGPMGAAAVAAAAVFAVIFGVTSKPAPHAGVVRWLDAGGRSVMLLEDDDESGVTIIWVLEGAAEGASRGAAHDVA
jgi:negative regulator of sigma E activity